MSPSPIQEGPRLVRLAGDAELPLRRFGGVGIWQRSTERTFNATHGAGRLPYHAADNLEALDGLSAKNGRRQRWYETPEEVVR